MAGVLAEKMARCRAFVADLLIQPAILACLPGASLVVYWLAGDTGLISTAVLVPFVYLIVFGLDGQAATYRSSLPSGLTDKRAFETIVETCFEDVSTSSLKSAIFVIELDEVEEFASRFGEAAADTIVARSADRIVASLRGEDTVAKTGDCKFSICLKPVQSLDLELCIQLAGRLQAALEEPISIDGTSVYFTGSIGFCLHTHVAKKSGRAWGEAARAALREAQMQGPGAIRAYSREMRHRNETRSELRQEVTQGLENGDIRPWFQPQISTDTGLVTGFEALARWHHPERGMISPAEFLPAIEAADMLERLAEVMMYHAFAALKAWDLAGIDVPQVGVNFAGPELRNPRLVEKVKWELDRFDLEPNRLAVEVLETVVARAPDDIITRNINALGQLGCRVDLDDFGTGHASIASIRRFSVSRIKIDRSFVMKADQDPDQQRMISAILTMAERLDIETLAEGVETVGEHALLAQLGCDHVQGFGIAKPMPFEDVPSWIALHTSKLQDVPHIMGGRAG